MVKLIKVVVAGGKSVGKTSILERAILGSLRPQQPYIPTIEDIYASFIETDRNHREKVRFYDTAGLDIGDDQSIPPHYHALADAFILVYSLTDFSSFQIVANLRKDIERNKEKKEIPIAVFGNKLDARYDSSFDSNVVENWAAGDATMKTWRTSIHDRQSLMDPLVHLISKFNPQPNRSSFPQLSISRRNKD